MEDLHLLIGKYGYKKIDDEIKRLKKETYEYLSKEEVLNEKKEVLNEKKDKVLVIVKKKRELITMEKLKEYGSLEELSKQSGYTEKYIDKLLKEKNVKEKVEKVEEPQKLEGKKIVVRVRKAVEKIEDVEEKGKNVEEKSKNVEEKGKNVEEKDEKAEELWKPYNEEYESSTKGEIREIKTKKIVEQFENGTAENKYVIINSKILAVNRIVATSHLEHPSEDHTVCRYKEGINNNIDNLYWDIPVKGKNNRGHIINKVNNKK